MATEHPIAAARSSAPPLPARVLALVSIIVAGACGGLIGYAFTEIQCDGDCVVLAGSIGVLAAMGAAIGVAVVAVLTLRAMAEWEAQEARARARRPPERRP
ncbi:MAG: hypothetical protein ACE5GB_01120 [Acidimicrobiales bacterium]